MESRSTSNFLTPYFLFSVLFALGGCSGCSTLSYLWQAGEGQLAIMNRARPIPEVLKDETTPPKIRELLGEVSRVKAFGEKMGLKATTSYQEYVKLDRDAAVYVVSACHPLKFEPKEWRFPIVGGFPYLGFYTMDGAKKYAGLLREEGLDVDLRGASAYSTLGWFRDPILSTMIPSGDRAAPELIEVILHESLHATAYVKHQAFFNESAASWVSEKLTPIFLQETRGLNSAEEKAYLASLVWQQKVSEKMVQAYAALGRIYDSSDSDSEKLRKKAQIIDGLKHDLKWPKARELNNATLIGYREYNGNRSVFDQIFQKCGADWKKFLPVLTGVTEKDFPEDQAKDLTGLVSKISCPQ